MHNNKYDYSLVEYKNSKTKIKILCPIHGEFEQIPKSHLKGCGCSKCSKNNKLNFNDFTKKSKKLHDNYYDYSEVKFKNCYTKIIIICKKHGKFEQMPYKHYQGHGCPKCKLSKGIKQICKILEKQNLDYETEKIIEGCNYINPLKFDIYIPKLDIYLEYDGEQHFKPIPGWGGKKAFKLIKKRDIKKDNFCSDHNKKLFRISYKQDIKKELCKILSIFITVV